ncbi:MAG: WG repeat-containing protein, partial [Bacteroidota bacterium]
QGRRYIIDRSGNPVLPQYRFDGPFYSGVARAQPGFRGAKLDRMADRSYTLVDTSGYFLFEPEFDGLGRWGNGVAPALVGSLIGDPLTHPRPISPIEEPGGRWGFINRKGEFVVNPTYQDIKGFNEGFAAVKQGGLWAYIDEDFQRITDYEFRWVDYFKNGIAEVRLSSVHGDYDGRFAYINNQGDIIWVEPRP